MLQVGEGVSGFKPGDRVAYGSSLGAYCSERIISAAPLVKLPDSIADETAAAMMLKGMTARYLLRQTHKVKAGDTLLVHAAAGGVGQILCQWATHLGATVIATVGSAAKAEIAKRLRRRLCHQLFRRGLRRAGEGHHRRRAVRCRL